jgi:hypothetical protein
MRHPLTTSPDAASIVNIPFRLHYVDDSGSATSGITSFSWLQLQPGVWAAAQQTWLAFRHDLHTFHGIPVSRRLHATDLAGGRRNPSTRDGWDSRRHGARLVRDGLRTIASIPGLTVGTVYRRFGSSALSDAKRDLYQQLVHALDADLRQRGLMGMVFMDGDGSDRSYATAHRRLPAQRRLIEEPVFRHAGFDQWVQMADLAAWSAFQSLTPNHRRQAARSWYPDILGPIDVFGGPIEL